MRTPWNANPVNGDANWPQRRALLRLGLPLSVMYRAAGNITMTTVELRQRVANLASNEQHSVDSAKYWKEVLAEDWTGPFPKEWCGAFTLWTLRKSLGCTWRWEVGKGYLYRLRATNAPNIGDICYMDKPYQHHAVLTAVGDDADGKPYVISQDGNSGNAPGECLEQWRSRDKWTAFYSIEPLINAALMPLPVSVGSTP